MGHENPVLLALLGRQPRIVMSGVYCGHFEGHWKTRQPLDRLIYIFEIGAEAGYIADTARRHPLAPGHWLLIPAGCESEHFQRPGLELISLHFNVEIFPRVEVLSGLGGIRSGDDPGARPLLERAAGPSPSPSDAFRLRNWMNSLLAGVFMKSPELLTGQFDRFSEFRPLFERFGRSVCRDCSVAEMAAVMKMGRENFVKRFTAAAGIPPKRFFNRLRAQASARELSEPGARINEIAARFGFSSGFAFSRFFSREMKQSPKAYRASLEMRRIGHS